MPNLAAERHLIRALLLYILICVMDKENNGQYVLSAFIAVVAQICLFRWLFSPSDEVK